MPGAWGLPGWPWALLGGLGPSPWSTVTSSARPGLWFWVSVEKERSQWQKLPGRRPRWTMLGDEVAGDLKPGEKRGGLRFHRMIFSS
jgi:hypothetical protein